MLTGKHFRLDTATLAIAESDGRRIAVTIPPGGTIKVVSSLNGDDRMIDVLWDGRILNMLYADLEARGKELPEASETRG